MAVARGDVRRFSIGIEIILQPMQNVTQGEDAKVHVLWMVEQHFSAFFRRVPKLQPRLI
jgi:hypothetical protein